MYIYTVADLHSKILDAPHPLQLSLFFMQFSAKFGQIIGWHHPFVLASPVWEILNPPLMYSLAIGEILKGPQLRVIAGRMREQGRYLILLFEFEGATSQVLCSGLPTEVWSRIGSHCMANRPHRTSVQPVNYVRLNSVGREHNIGSMSESPLNVNVDENGDFESEFTQVSGPDRSDESIQQGEESVMTADPVNPETDLDCDEEWGRQQQILAANREKRERDRLLLERRRELAQARLKEEEEKKRMAEMERDILEMENKRSVCRTRTQKIRDSTRRGNMADEGDNVDIMSIEAKVTSDAQRPQESRGIPESELSLK